VTRFGVAALRFSVESELGFAWPGLDWGSGGI
jgi:hypothetical protein